MENGDAFFQDSWIENSIKIEIYCNIINLFTATFAQFEVSFLNKVKVLIFIYLKKNVLTPNI